MMSVSLRKTLMGIAAAIAMAGVPAHAQTTNLEAEFDNAFGTEIRAPESFEAVYETSFERRTSEFPLLIPLRSARFSSPAAPVREGNYMAADQLIEIMIARSSNPATNALLRAVGGPEAVNNWVRRQGIEEFSIDRDIATLVRDDGEFDPSMHIDRRDAATPRAMIQLLQGLYQGKFLSDESRQVILDAMAKTRTGTRRIPAEMPDYVEVMHKTGSLNNTSSDIGILEGPNGHAIAVAIYVTGQGARRAREARIASIARALYDGFAEKAGVSQPRVWTSTARPGG